MCRMTVARSSSVDPSQLGLRERKKIKTRAAIRRATYDLVREQGYEATTVEQIAERAEVSVSTVFRYFPAKEDIVLTDEYEPLLMERVRERPPGEPWMRTLRQVMALAVGMGMDEDPDLLRLRARLIAQVPAVRARMLEAGAGVGRQLARAVGERTGRDADGLEVRVYAMSLVGALTEVTRYWAEHGFRDDLHELLDRALDVVEHGPAAEKG
ncbi:TetR family transcriptional regulator [Streptomyces sp. NBRC 14336]|nr:TetR family transcriptional regulator [Streptomyces sp. NBRC 14336]